MSDLLPMLMVIAATAGCIAIAVAGAIVLIGRPATTTQVPDADSVLEAERQINAVHRATRQAMIDVALRQQGRHYVR
jgi:hypothetical protein